MPEATPAFEPQPTHSSPSSPPVAARDAVAHPAADLLASALDPEGRSITRRTTHVSTVLFHDGFAYKVKRPVRFEFLDQSTPELRREACVRELELNRRFAPDVYLDVVEVRDAAGGVVDHALRMRRLPDEQRLSEQIRGSARSLAVRSVARAVAVAHGRSRRSPEIDRAASSSALQTLWLRSLTDMNTFVPSVLDHATFSSVAIRARMYLDGRERLFEQRVADGMIVDGHGDLLADDIFVGSHSPDLGAVHILDCLDFDDQLRHGDVLADLAFLVMDLERLGHPGLGAELLRWYDEYSGTVHPATLQHHYVAYRALVRSKIACLRAQAKGTLPPFGRDGFGVPPTDADIVEARSLLTIAARHLQKGSVHLVAVGGLPGSGKSTLADNVGRAMGWAVIRSDEVRKELVGGAPEAGDRPVRVSSDGTRNAYGAGAYLPEHTDRTYAEMFLRAAAALQLGQSVIIDASFVADARRRDAADVARATRSVFVPLRCEAPFDVLARRIVARRDNADEPSEATPEIALEMARRADPWPSAFTIETSRSPEESCQAALDILSMA